MKMKRISIIAIVLVVLMLFTACGPAVDDTPAVTTPPATSTPTVTPTPTPVVSVTYGEVENRYVFAAEAIALCAYPDDEQQIRELPAKSLLTVEQAGWVGEEQWYYVYAYNMKNPSDNYGWIRAEQVVPYTTMLQPEVEYPVMVDAGSDFWANDAFWINKDEPNKLERTAVCQVLGDYKEFVKLGFPGGEVYWVREEDVYLDMEPQLVKHIGGSRRYEEYTDHLIPADDYGPLVAYIGARNPQGWSESNRYWNMKYFYGLMTREGEIITDPVYSRVEYGNEGYENVLILSKGDREVESITLAAVDGSWVIENDAKIFMQSSYGLLFLSATELAAYSSDGEVLNVCTFEDWNVAERWEETEDVFYDAPPGSMQKNYITVFSTAETVFAVNLDTFTMEELHWTTWMDFIMDHECDPEPLPATSWFEETEDSTIYVNGEERYVIPHVNSVHTRIGDIIVFEDGAVYALDGVELYPAELGCTIWSLHDRMTGRKGAVVRHCSGENAVNRCLRPDGSEIPLPGEGKPILPGTWDGKDMAVSGGLLELSDEERAVYYDIATGELVCEIIMG